MKDSEWIERLKDNHRKPIDATDVKYSEEYDTEIQNKELNHYIISINAVGSLQVAALSVSFQQAPNCSAKIPK